ncbi:phosphate ABC transporter substrate-binding protein PstS [Bradyrhizobium liaoningense]
MIKRVIAATTILASFIASSAVAWETRGGGSSFVAPILDKWAAEYGAKTGNHVAYESVGSGAGIAMIKKAQVDFGATDMPLTPNELAKFGLMQFPLVIGGVVPVVNVPRVKSGDLHFTGPVLADIFLGRITRWDDPALRELNPDLKLPAANISVIHRTDGSGTTFNFANYLSKVSPEWRTKIGEGAVVEWPIGYGAKGNEGVAALVGQLGNAISYVEYAYAVKNNLAFGLVRNSAGRFISPAAKSFQKAADQADWKGSRDFYLIMTNSAEADAYPIAATAFVLMERRPHNPEGARAARDFFRWSLKNGRSAAEELNYVPLPADLVQQIENYWKDDLGG